MTGPYRHLAKLLLLGGGLAIAGGILRSVEQGYRVHEQKILSRPYFQPPGIKYAYAVPPEPGTIRGWVAGMRPPDKTPGMTRIVAVGDSVTYGLGTRTENAWPGQLQRRLPNTEVFNLAMCGWDSEQSVSLTTGHLAAWQPDLVVWGTYTNDVLPTYLMWGAHDEHPVFVGTSIPEDIRALPEPMGLWLVRNTAMYRQFLAARMARAQSTGLQLGPQLSWYSEQLNKLHQWATKTGIPVLVVAIPAHTQAQPSQCASVWNEHDCRQQAEGHRSIVDALQRTQLNWIDGQKLYAASGRPHFMLRPGEQAGPGAWEKDAEHPTAAGHAVLADGMVPEVKRLLGW